MMEVYCACAGACLNEPDASCAPHALLAPLAPHLCSPRSRLIAPIAYDGDNEVNGQFAVTICAE
jgi:hypothetical protein